MHNAVASQIHNDFAERLTKTSESGLWIILVPYPEALHQLLIGEKLVQDEAYMKK